MIEPYDPLKDPTSDGFKFVGVAVDPTIEKALAPTKEEWKAASQSALGGANAAPDATPAQSNSFWRWFKWGAVALFLGICWLAYSQYQAHKAEVTQIQNAPSVTPEIVASPSVKAATKGKKSATEKIAAQTANAPAMPSFEAEKQPEKLIEKQSLPKKELDETPIDLPLRPIPPIPPQRSIP